jgi:hypothetical protein
MADHFEFLNTNSTVPAHAVIEFFSDSGAPRALDFGDGPTTKATLTIAAGGTQTLSSKATSPTTVSGWAVAACDQAVQGTLTFRGIVNGTPQQAVSALASLPGLEYTSPATYSTGVALANIYSTPVTLQVIATDSAGNTSGTANATLPADGHMAFNLNSMMPSLSPSFTGSVTVNAIDNSYFVGWTLAVDNSGVLSSYPPGTLEWPISHVDRIWDVYYRDLNGAQLVANSLNLGLIVNRQTVPLHIQSDRYLNAYASKADNSINIELSLSELISDSQSELAFAVGHEMGHTMQFRTGKYLFYPNYPEWDADVWGMLISLDAGYDPYAAAGALAKLSMATGDASLSNQLVDNGSNDPHGSFNTRIANVFAMLQLACAQPGAAAACAQYKTVIHPHFPGSAPLDKKPVTASDVVRP